MKTVPTEIPVAEFLASVEPVRRREDAFTLLEMMTHITGREPVMWGSSIIGYGRYDYRYDSGHSGSFFRTGFSPRKIALTVYIMPGYQDYSDLLARLGKHKIGKSCLYINKLGDVDLDVLEELVRAGLKRMEELYPEKA